MEHLPISVTPHWGHLKNVIPFPTNLLPHELQTFSFSIAIARARLDFLYKYIRGLEALRIFVSGKADK